MLAFLLGAALLSGLSSGSISPVYAAAPKELRITLFGTPCLLRGPFDEAMLMRIHSISPSELEPPESRQLALKHVERLKGAQPLPQALDHYRNTQIKRLGAQADFFEALEKARKNKKVDALIAVGKKHFKSKDRKAYEAAASKFRAKEGGAQLLETFRDGIEPDPQEEFHRVTRQLGIEYVCVFEEDGGEEAEDPGAEVPEASSQ
jgi:hypothetical protein